MKFGSRNFSLVRSAVAIAAAVLLSESAPLAQVKTTTPTPPARIRSGPAQQKQRSPAPQQSVRQPQRRQPNATQAPSEPKAPSVKPAPQTVQPTAPTALPPPQAPPPVDASQPPPSLPRASREKMRACAEEWDRMKRESKDGLPMWRDFATDCLTR